MQATRRAARSGELSEPSLVSRAPYDAWHAMGLRAMYDRARERVRGILAGPVVDPVSDAMLAEVGPILAEADAGLREA